MAPAPPAWADTWLRLLLPARDRDTVSGDLMEEYREHIRPQKSQLAADAWYIGQVARFAWRQALWAFALAAIYESRLVFDWFVPTTNFAHCDNWIGRHLHRSHGIYLCELAKCRTGVGHDRKRRVE